MAHATNRIEMLAKALKRARPDFTLHNSRAFARAVIDAPADVFGDKPLTFLPTDQASSNFWQDASDSANPSTSAELYGFENGAPVEGAHAETGRYFTSYVQGVDARPGDVVVGDQGTGIVLGEGMILDSSGVVHSAPSDGAFTIADSDDEQRHRGEVLDVLLPLFGLEITSPYASRLDKVLTPTFRAPRGISDTKALSEHLRCSADAHASFLFEAIDDWFGEPGPLTLRRLQSRYRNCDPGYLDSVRTWLDAYLRGDHSGVQPEPYSFEVGDLIVDERGRVLTVVDRCTATYSDSGRSPSYKVRNVAGSAAAFLTKRTCDDAPAGGG